MSETADKYRRRGYWLKYLALRHIELLYYKPPFLSTTFSPYFHLFFQKVFHILTGLPINFSTKPACCLHLIHAHPQQVAFGTTIYKVTVHSVHSNFIHTLIRHFINFLWYFSPQCATLERMYPPDTQ